MLLLKKIFKIIAYIAIFSYFALFLLSLAEPQKFEPKEPYICTDTVVLIPVPFDEYLQILYKKYGKL